MSPPLTPLSAFTDSPGRLVVYAPWLLCTRVERPCQGSSWQPLRVISHRCLQERGFVSSADAEPAFSAPRAVGENVVHLDPYVLLRGTSLARDSTIGF